MGSRCFMCGLYMRIQSFNVSIFRHVFKFEVTRPYYTCNVCNVMVFKYNKFTVKGMTINSVPGNMKTRSGPQIKYFIPAEK